MRAGSCDGAGWGKRRIEGTKADRASVHSRSSELLDIGRKDNDQGASPLTWCEVKGPGRRMEMGYSITLFKRKLKAPT